jgi:hypothetical protein
LQHVQKFAAPHTKKAHLYDKCDPSEALDHEDNSNDTLESGLLRPDGMLASRSLLETSFARKKNNIKHKGKSSVRTAQ